MTDITTDPSFDLSSLLPCVGKSSCPLPDRITTNVALDALLVESLRPSPCDVFGSGPLLISDIPIKVMNCKSRGVILGIDEAGRGPVLGPMCYAAAYWLPDDDASIPRGFNDSKQLSPAQRSSLFNDIRTSESIGFALRILYASEISRNMLRKMPYNLNAMSHDAAMEIIWAILAAGVKIERCYIDTVGVPEAYKKKLDGVFQGYSIEFIVEKKADAKYPPCSAASVVAKEARDTIMANWKWTERHNYEPKDSANFGSGYPSDQTCRNWLNGNCNIDSPFGFPDLVRFSWGPAKNGLIEEEEKCNLMVRWEADDEQEEEGSSQQSSLDTFFTTTKEDKTHIKKRGLLSGQRKRLAIFDDLGLSKVTKM